MSKIIQITCSSAYDENCVCCLSKESAEIEFVLESYILCRPVSKSPRYEKHIFESYDDDNIFLPVLNLERHHVIDNKEQFSHVG
jgi:hypothetical protein